MTTANSSAQLWRTMPGWGIVANLLPPEVVASRRVRTLRKIVVCALLAVALLGGGGYAWAFWQVHTASSALTEAQTRTLQLESEQTKYSPVVQVETETAHVQSQLQTLLASDVNLPPLLAAIIQRSPNPSGITQLQVDVTAASPNATTSGSDATGDLDMSGRAHIGTITVGGLTRSISDVAKSVSRLAQVPGVVEVFPTSQQNDGKTVTYSLQMTITDQLLSPDNTTTTAATTTGGN